MLGKLSVRNAKRQFRDYTLYLITLICAISFMYAFNAFLFSDSIKALSELEILPYMIIVSTLLIIFVLGWVVNYMTNYMLKRRSREFSVYMVLGITNRSIGRLIFRENLIIGAVAYVLSLPAGILLSQLLQAALLRMFAQSYSLNLSLSLRTAVLTPVYFVSIFLFSLLKNRKWVRRIKLYDLLCYDRQNEKHILAGRAPAIAVFLLSITSGCLGLILISLQPLGKGYDYLLGMILLALFLFGFFLSIPSFLAAISENRNAWKYTKDHLITFRLFTSKIRSMSITMAVLSILFMLALTFIGIGISANKLAAKSVDSNAFDLMILHSKESRDFSAYEKLIARTAPIRSSHTYNIYTNTKQDFLTVRDKAVSAIGRPRSFLYEEYQHDTYMTQSDYTILRKILGYEKVEMSENSYYIHCVPALKNNFAGYISQNPTLTLSGRTITAGRILTEPFAQSDSYGNGFDYIIIIPDPLAGQLEILYSLYAVMTESPLNSAALQTITDASNGQLTLLDRSTIRSTSGKYGTSLIHPTADYLTGKWVQKEALSQMYALLVCLFYLALILEITGAAILATQLLSDKEKKRKQDNILRRLGMTNKQITKQNTRQLTLLFLLPLLPALIISTSLIYTTAEKIHHTEFHLPILTGQLWIYQSIGTSLLLFTLLYSIYYQTARITNNSYES